MVRIAFHPKYHLPLPPEHRFPMEKYSLLPEMLVYHGICSEQQFFRPGEADWKVVERIHTQAYCAALRNFSLPRQMIRRIGFPLDSSTIERELLLTQGTIEAAAFALEYGLSYNIAGGTHHAFADCGEGFCVLNDNAVAAQYLLDNQLVKKILVVDLDVHQGNGTASIFSGRNDVFTFSMHGANNFPFRKEQSHLDIALPDGIGDREYLNLLDQNLNTILDDFQPDFIFYQAGVDILAEDKMGKLHCSLEGCAKRDRMVLEAAKTHKIPICVTMGGGYAPKIATILNAHSATYAIGMELYS